MSRAHATPPHEPPERRSGEPNRRALAAMASAASRARQSGNGAGRTDGNEETGTRRLVARSTTSARPQNVTSNEPLLPPEIPPRARIEAHQRAVGTTGRGVWRVRWGLDGWGLDNRPVRALLVTTTIGVLVLAVIGLTLGLALRSSPSKSVTNRASARHAGTGHATSKSAGRKTRSSGQSTPSPSAGADNTTSPSSSTTPSPAPTGAPRLVSASPISGAPGNAVVVEGTGLFSSNGQVLAYFDGTDAPTSCTTRTSCTVVVPDLGLGPSTVHLTVVTVQGTSNALTFSYR